MNNAISTSMQNNPNILYAYRDKVYILYIEILKIMFILFLGSISIYYFRSIPLLRTFFYVMIFTAYYYSRNEEFWITILFLMGVNIFGMFALRPYAWIFQLTPTVGVDWTTIIPIVILAKYFLRTSSKNGRIQDLLKNKYRIFVHYLLYLLIWGLLYGHTAASLMMTWNSITIFLMFIYLPSVLSYKKMLYVSKVIFTFSIIITTVSVIELLFGNIITRFIVFGGRQTTIITADGQLARQFIGVFIAYYSLIMCLFYISNKRNDFSTVYLLIVSVVSFFSILNTATRGWMIAMIILMIMYMFIYVKKVLTMMFVPKIIFSILILVALIFTVTPQRVRNNFLAAFDRLNTLEAIYTEGDLSAGGTSSRWDFRGPRVLTRFKESPIFGFGYSKVTQMFFDGHVGNHTLLLQGGVMGFFIVYLTIMTLIIYFFKKEFYGIKGAGVFGLALISMIIIHSTSRNMISFQMGMDITFILCLLFAHYNAYIHLLKTEKAINTR